MPESEGARGNVENNRRERDAARARIGSLIRRKGEGNCMAHA